VPAHISLRLPFSSHLSSKICLHAALNIVTLLDNLPYPNPNPATLNMNMNMARSPPRLSPRSPIEVPRTMPTFACCAVQSSYAMLMLCFKTHTLHQSRKLSMQSQTQNQNLCDGEGGPAAENATYEDDDEGDVTEDENPLLAGFMNDLYQGLQLIIKSLANYSIAFEALQGMKSMY
jgi:hypothetical protein